jgi:hypothetical protein
MEVQRFPREEAVLTAFGETSGALQHASLWITIGTNGYSIIWWNNYIMTVTVSFRGCFFELCVDFERWFVLGRAWGAGQAITIQAVHILQLRLLAPYQLYSLTTSGLGHEQIEASGTGCTTALPVTEHVVIAVFFFRLLFFFFFHNTRQGLRGVRTRSVGKGQSALDKNRLHWNLLNIIPIYKREGIMDLFNWHKIRVIRP